MDIQKITRELLATGLTQQALADLVPCSQSTIASFLNGTRGKKPSFATGARLLELHTERCKDEQATSTG
jgi:transcriptional regulator with XRE-family HTH domain